MFSLFYSFSYNYITVEQIKNIVSAPCIDLKPDINFLGFIVYIIEKAKNKLSKNEI